MNTTKQIVRNTIQRRDAKTQRRKENIKLFYKPVYEKDNYCIRFIEFLFLFAPSRLCVSALNCFISYPSSFNLYPLSFVFSVSALNCGSYDLCSLEGGVLPLGFPEFPVHKLGMNLLNGMPIELHKANT